MKNACKSGIGAATVKVAGVTVTAVVAVNAMGDVVDESGKIIAGAKGRKGEFIDTEKCLANGEFAKLLLGTNTTIGCIITDAKLSKVEANLIASISHNGLARAIRPVHTMYDGDTMFCLASGRLPVVNLAPVQSAAVEATRLAIVNAVSKSAQYEIVFDQDEDCDTQQ